MHITAKFFAAKFFAVDIDGSPEVTITGLRAAVLHVVARASGLAGLDAVEIRWSPNDDGTMVIVDARQAHEYPAYLAEIAAAAAALNPTTTFAPGQTVTILAAPPSYPLARGKRGQVNSITTDPVSGDTVYSVLTTERVGVQPRTRPGGPGGDLYEVHGLRSADLSAASLPGEVESGAPDPVDQTLAYRPPGVPRPEAGAETSRCVFRVGLASRLASIVLQHDEVSGGDGPDFGAALRWAETAVAGEYLVEYEDHAGTLTDDQIEDALERDLVLSDDAMAARQSNDNAQRARARRQISDALDPGSRCGYDDAELDQIQRALAARDLRLAADDRGLVAQAVRP